MSVPQTSKQILRIADLAADRPHRFEIVVEAETRASLAADLDILGIRKFRFVGALSPLAAKDWHLSAQLGATVVQACVVSLDPVVTRIEESVSRSYLASLPELPAGEEIEMPEDDGAEPLPETIDLIGVATEALALALPAYPRADGVTLEKTNFAGPGIAPMTDEEAKPFAGLAALKNKLDGQADT